VLADEQQSVRPTPTDAFRAAELFDLSEGDQTYVQSVASLLRATLEKA
jgi:hypothetical protein